MTDIHVHGKVGWIGRFARWLFGSPFRSLPPVFGDQTPPDLRVFEAEVEEARHEVQEVPAPPGAKQAGTEEIVRVGCRRKGSSLSRYNRG